jgi:serine/threonine protein kinase
MRTIQMKPGVFREEYIAIIVRELLRGLEYLHSEGKLHRDIKGVSIGFEVRRVGPPDSSRWCHYPIQPPVY